METLRKVHPKTVQMLIASGLLWAASLFCLMLGLNGHSSADAQDFMFYAASINGLIALGLTGFSMLRFISNINR